MNTGPFRGGIYQNRRWCKGAAYRNGVTSCPTTGYGELAVEGRQPVAVDCAGLRRLGADKLGVIVDFEDGVLPDGHSGAMRLSRPGA
jgi:hypothetical protein